MKKTALTMAVSSLMLAGTAQAAPLYDQDGTKLEIGGRVQGMYYGTSNDALEGDQSYLRLHVAGETRIDDETKAFAFAEYNLPTSGSDNDELRYGYVGIQNDRFGAFSYGRQDGLFAKAVNNYTDVLPEWGGDGLGKDTDVFGTGRNNGLAQYIYTYQGMTLGAQFTGKNDPWNDKDSKWMKGSDEGYALSANYDFDMGISLGAVYNMATKTGDQKELASFGGDDDAQLYGAGIKYTAGNLYLAATYAHGQDHVFVSKNGQSGYAEKSDGYEAVAQYSVTPKFKPSLAYLRTDVKDDRSGANIDDTLTEYVSVGAWYNFTDNFNAYVDYKINLLDEDGSDGYSSLGQVSDDVVGVALQYNF